MSALPSTRSRYQLPPHRQRDYPIHLIDQGLPILESLRNMGFATHGQLTALHIANRVNRKGHIRTFAGPDRAAITALKRLWEARFLDRRPIMLAGRSSGLAYQHFVNVLTAKGQRALNPELIRPRTVSVSQQTVEHSLAINDQYVLVHRAAEMHGIGVHDWLDDRRLTSMQAKGSLRLVSIPDAFFVLSYQGRYFGHFLEVDTGSVQVRGRRSGPSWTQTIVEYGQYFRDHYPVDGFFRGFSAPIVLTVTSSQARLDHLLTATRKAGGAGVYWYTTAQEINPFQFDPGTGRATDFDPSVFWQPIWRVVNDREPRSILTRLEKSVGS